ncbi:hypothetical protein [Kocuria rosea]|uniref:hypothetical protein n=1 Tax=Kocuria rosea TaxID=1275 RepID=UPI0011B219EB|nr:hypothetical protein [Kocuria rosea]
MDNIPAPSLSEEYFKYWILDMEEKQIKAILQDGRETSTPISDGDPLLDSEIAKSIFDWEKRWIFNLTKKGHLIISSAYNALGEPPLSGQPVVYLDQNHWSTVAHSLLDAERVKAPARLEAATRVATLANDAGIILPLSSAHLKETTHLYGGRRYNLGVTIAHLSGGWQMRHPIEVWKSEVLMVLAEVSKVPQPRRTTAPVITLEPQAALKGTPEVREMEADANLFLLTLTEPSATLDLLIHPEKIDPITSPGWIERNQAITKYVSELELDTRLKRLEALKFFWLECIQMTTREIEGLELDQDAIKRLSIREIEAHILAQPMLSYLSHLFVQRYINKSIQWKMNDLTDMIFLASAAGYCDYVVAEKHTGTQLQQMQRSAGQKLTIFTSIEDLVTALDEDGVKTATEKGQATG